MRYLIIGLTIGMVLACVAPTAAQDRPTELSLGGAYHVDPDGGSPGFALMARDPFIGPVDFVGRLGGLCNPERDGCRVEHVFGTAGLALRLVNHRRYTFDLGGGLRLGDMGERTYAPYGDIALTRWINTDVGLSVSLMAEQGAEHGLNGVAMVGLSWAIGW